MWAALLARAPCQLFTSLDGWCFGRESCQVSVYVNSVFDMCYVDHREPLERPSCGRTKHSFPIYHRYFSDGCIPARPYHLSFKQSSFPHCPPLECQPWPGSSDCPYYQLIEKASLSPAHYCQWGSFSFQAQDDINYYILSFWLKGVRWHKILPGVEMHTKAFSKIYIHLMMVLV